ncbi:uncharacterized protein ACR2FA_008230 [Aphomia sociella]
MVFKLVRTDTEDPYKIQLKAGTHLIGRGKFLNCDDKRVSRNHGELEVNEDTVIIKALHQNPCFYIKKGIEDTQILRQNSTVNLNNGDKFGMLPDSYWYEVLHCIMPDVNRQTPERQAVDNFDNYSVDTEPVEVNVTQSCDDNTNDSSGPQLQIDEADRPDSPSLLGTVEQSTSNIQLEEPLKNEVTSAEEPTSKSDDVNRQSNDENAIKRCHSPSGDSDLTKKIKVENDVKQEPDDAQSGPSNDQMDASGSHDRKSPQPSPAKPQNPQLRERCIYGANCYRKNPQHKAQFSHPADADWGPGERGACPWGRGCRRRHPGHWRAHRHPPGTQPPHDTPGMQVVQRNGNVFYIQAHAVNFYDDHFQVEDSDGDSVDYDYEF